MLGPVTGGLISWVCNKLADEGIKKLRSNKQLARDIDKAVARWAKSLPEDHFVEPQALFPTDGSATIAEERPQYRALRAKLMQNELPPKDMWHAVFMESWRLVREAVDEPQPFFVCKKKIE